MVQGHEYRMNGYKECFSAFVKCSFVSAEKV